MGRNNIKEKDKLKQNNKELGEQKISKVTDGRRKKSNEKAGNQDKQRNSAKKKAMKKLNFEEKTRETQSVGHKRSNKEPVLASSSKLPKNDKVKATAQFVEDGDEIVFEVEGQATEFDSEVRIRFRSGFGWRTHAGGEFK